MPADSSARPEGPAGGQAAAADENYWNQRWTDFACTSDIGPANEYRRRLVLRLLDIPNHDGAVSLLEIGSGTGIFAEAFHARYPSASLLGVELSRVGVEIASRRVPSARFIQRDLLLPAGPGALPEPKAGFAVCTEVLEHLEDPVLLLRHAAEYMAPGCKLVVTVPGGPMSAFDRHIGHWRHYRPRELRSLLERAGFTVERACGAGFPFFNLYRAGTILRGRKLQEDVAGAPSIALRVTMAIFAMLFHLNLSRWGWQTVAVARYRGAER